MRSFPVFVGLVLATGCGRVGFDSHPPVSDGGSGVGLDAPADAASEGGPTDADVGVDAEGDAATCEEDPCRVVLPQCGCTAGQMCGWNTIGLPTCTVASDRPVGEVCTRDHDCVPGAGCIFFGPSTGLCHWFCDSAADCPADTRCVRLSWATPPGICSTSCEPVDQAGCPGSTACGLGLAVEVPSGDVVSANFCSPPGPGAVDTPCSGPQDCGRGLVCNGVVCKPICRVGDPSTCTATCLGFTPPSIVGGIEYGTCE